MVEIDRAIIVRIHNDYDAVSDFLHWLIENRDLPQFRGGMSGRGSYVGYFPIDQQDKIAKFFEGRDLDPTFDDDF